jgi:hypothetical protein
MSTAKFRLMIRAYLGTVAALVIAGVFLVSAAGKIRNPGAYRGFRTSVTDLTGLPPGPARLTAPAVIGAELLVVALVAIRSVTAPILALLLLTAFTVVLGRARARATDRPCNCFFASTSPVGTRHVVRNLVLMLVGAAALALRTMPLAPGGWAMAALAAGPLVAVVVYWDTLADLFTPMAA